MNKTKKMMTGILTAALAATVVGCDGDEQVKEGKFPDVEEVSTKEVKEKKADYSFDDECEVELDHLASKYPNVDLDAIEDYLEDQGNDCKYDSDELEAFIADLNDNGEPTTSNSYSSSFPWWLFLLSNNSSRISSHSGITNKQHVTKPVTPSKPAINSGAQSKPNTSSQPSKSTNSNISTGTKNTTGSSNINAGTTSSSTKVGSSSSSSSKVSSGYGSSSSSYGG